jgi:hypothetical protein
MCVLCVCVPHSFWDHTEPLATHLAVADPLAATPAMFSQEGVDYRELQQGYSPDDTVGTCAGGDDPTSATKAACEGAGTCTAIADGLTAVGMESACDGVGSWVAGPGVFTSSAVLWSDTWSYTNVYAGMNMSNTSMSCESNATFAGINCTDLPTYTNNTFCGQVGASSIAFNTTLLH